MASNEGGNAEAISEVNAERRTLEQAKKSIEDNGWKIVDKKKLFNNFYFELNLSLDV